MGRPQADASSYENDQHQEFDLQPQEYQYEPTVQAQDSQDLGFSAQQTYETNHYTVSSQEDDLNQSQYGDTSTNNPEVQLPQQQQQQPPHQQLQGQQYPPLQANQGYGGQQAQPSQFPFQSPQTNPMYSNGPNRPPPYPPQGLQTNPTQPVQFPPQNPIQPESYPPQSPQKIPAQPVQFPPQNPIQPASYPPQSPQTIPTQPVQFPPQKPAAYPPQGIQTLSNQPVQFPPQSPEMNPMYQGGLNQPTQYPPPQAFPPKAVGPQQAFINQNAYQGPQPQAVQFPPKSPADGIPLQMNQLQQQQGWKTGLFDCMEDPTNALTTACFPCVTFGQVAEIVDNGQTSCTTNGMLYGMVAFCIAMPCLVSCGYRTKLRSRFGLIEDPAPDWLTHCLFECCALCQEYRELQHRGFDPSIGWQGIVARQSMQQAQVGMVPPMNQRMMA